MKLGPTAARLLQRIMATQPHFPAVGVRPRRPTMGSTTEVDRRNRLAYLALYYAILGDDDRSEKLRRLVRRMSEASESVHAASEEAVTA